MLLKDIMFILNAFYVYHMKVFLFVMNTFYCSNSDLKSVFDLPDLDLRYGKRQQFGLFWRFLVKPRMQILLMKKCVPQGCMSLLSRISGRYR